MRSSIPTFRIRVALVAVLVGSAWWAPAASAAETRLPPSAPSVVRAVALTPSEVTVEWGPGGRDTRSYTLRRDGVVIGTVDAATRSFSDLSVEAGRRYTYVVEAVGSDGSSAARAARVKTPSALEGADRYRPTVPEDVHAVSQADGSVLVDWQGSNDESDISGYVIRQGDRQVATVDAGTLQFLDGRTSRAPGAYTVEAVDVAGHRSGRSEPATVQAAEPSARGSSATATDPGPSAVGALAEAAYLPSLRRYPYLTDVVNSADGTTGYATINWATTPLSITAAAQWGAVDGNGACTPTNTVAAVRTGFQVNGVTLSQWKANLTLAPDQDYCYRVTLGGVDQLGGDPSPRFRTLPPTGSAAPISFAVLGDWGQVDSVSSNPDQANVLAQLAASGVSFALTTGDNAYASGSQNNYGDLVEVGPELGAVFGPQFWSIPGRSIPLFPSIGNHGFLRNDTNHPHLTNWPQDRAVSQSNGRYQKDTYCCKLGTASLSLPSTWYAFDAGRVRIYVLQAAWSDSNGGVNGDPYEVDAAYQWAPGSPQYDWLQQDLAAHPNQVKMAAFHYPLYSDQKHETSDTFLHGPGSLQGLLDQYGVKFAFNGHAHIYQRNLPDAGGMVSYLTGGGGAKAQSVGEDPCLAIDAYAIGWSNSSNTGNACGAASPPSSAAEVYHFLKVTLDGTQVTVTPINSLGQAFDVQTYELGEPPPDTEPPSVPTGVSAVAASSTRIDIAWSASTDNVAVTAYDIVRDGATVATVSGATLAYADETVAPNTTYGYQVIATDGVNASAPSTPAATATTPAAPDTEPPSVPTGVSAVAVSSSEIAVAWAASSDNVAVTGYDIVRDGVVIASVSGTTLTFADLTVAPATTYGYRIVATDGVNPSAPSDPPATATTPGIPDTEAPSAPTGVLAVATSSSLVDISWSASTDNVGVDGYDILRDGAVIASVPGSSLTYADATVAPTTTYSYRVVARDLAGNSSAPSAAADTTTPGAPVTVTFVATEDSYTDATTGATNYGTAGNVFADTAPSQRGYLKFVVSGIGAGVESAVIRLRVTDSTSNAPQLATTTSGWTETGLTWNNQPAAGQVLGDLGSVSKNTFVDYPVTVAVTGNGTYSFVLLAQSSNGLGVASRQATTLGNRPQLIVTYVPSSIPDTEAPSAPTGVLAVATSSSLVDISWSASTDNVGVDGYDILRDGAVIASVPGSSLTYADATVAPTTTYSYRVVARDLAGNSSAPSDAADTTTPGAPVTVTFVATEDSYTDATTGATNYGTAGNVFADTAPSQRGYLKFVVSGIGAGVESAVVRLRVTDSTSNAPQLATTTSGWTETGLTWNNQPAAGQVLSDLGSVSKNTFVDYPVTVAVTGNGTYSFVLLAQSSNGLGVASRQATTLGNRPQLIVTYH